MRGIEPICQSYDKALGHNSSQKLCMGRYRKVNVLKKEIKLKYNLTRYFMKILGCRDPRFQDISTSISIVVKIQKNLNDLTENCEDDADESDKYLEARD